MTARRNVIYSNINYEHELSIFFALKQSLNFTFLLKLVSKMRFCCLHQIQFPKVILHTSKAY